MCSDDPRLRRLILYVESNLDKPLTLTMAAEIVGLERTYFSKLFKISTSYRFSEWNRAIRIRRAKELLRLRGMTVMGAALAVGYYDVTTFTRAFKKCNNGVGPRAYRSALQSRLRYQITYHLSGDKCSLEDSMARNAERSATNAEKKPNNAES